MIKPETFSLVTEENIKVDMSLYRSEINRKDITIIYFHGGGLLYGVRDDLPEIYISEFLNSGYDLLALDYPLAPESKIDVILYSSYEEILYFLRNHNNVLGLKNQTYILFGRSAGAYMCFMMCNMLIKNFMPTPTAIISLYGYARLDEIEFITPSKYYNKLPPVPNESIKRIISDKPVLHGPMDVRFSLYIKARQEGTWIDCICGKGSMPDYSINREELSNFPQTILAAATLDPDVPYRVSKAISRLIPNSRLITVYGETHDFDRDVKDRQGKLVYNEIINWLDNLQYDL